MSNESPARPGVGTEHDGIAQTRPDDVRGRLTRRQVLAAATTGVALAAPVVGSAAPAPEVASADELAAASVLTGARLTPEQLAGEGPAIAFYLAHLATLRELRSTDETPATEFTA